MIEVALDRMRPIADERGITLRAETPEGLPDALADGKRVGEALMNLIDNALKFTPSKWRRDGLGGMLRGRVPPNKSQPRGRKSATRHAPASADGSRARHRRGHPL